MADIFVSYARADLDRARVLAEALEAHGWTVWWDRQIAPGRTFDDVIEKALDEAHAIVSIWTETSIDSQWVRTEATEGLSRGILVPVRMDDVRLPLAFRRVQTADLSDWTSGRDHEGFDDLVAALDLLIPSDASDADVEALAVAIDETVADARLLADRSDWAGVLAVLSALDDQVEGAIAASPAATELMSRARREVGAGLIEQAGGFDAPAMPPPEPARTPPPPAPPHADAEPDSPPVVPPSPPSPDRDLEPSRNVARWVVVGVAIVLVGLAVGALFVFSGGDGSDEASANAVTVTEPSAVETDPPSTTTLPDVQTLPQDETPPTDEAVPTTRQEQRRRATTVAPTTAVPTTVTTTLPQDGILENWFGRPAEEAIAALTLRGFVVQEYIVCSGSVAAGEVRRIYRGDVIYLDKEGVTAEGVLLPAGSTVEMLVGNGTAC